jgi:hypothetical protein
MFLKDAQKRLLNQERQLCDFVQEQSAAVRLLY